MIPTIIEIGPIPIRSFGLMVALALFAGAIRLSISFARYGISPQLAERYVTAAGISGLLGARVWYLIENWSWVKNDFFSAAFASAGFTFYGGFIIAAVVVYSMAKRDGVPMGKFCDSFGPALALGYAIGRLGCQLSGDGDYGSATSGLWGMSYATGVVPTLPGERVYPTPLFESVISLAIVFFLSYIERGERYFAKPLQRFGLYLICISAERVFVEIFRINPSILWRLSEAQVIGTVLLFLGAMMVWMPRGRSTAAS